jgi:phosphatidylethanolamine/phosphatidyl-N-methylethanolamine N-methyltransferase
LRSDPDLDTGAGIGSRAAAPSPNSAASPPLSTDQVRRTYRFYAPFYDRLFGAVLEPGRRALAAAVTALQPGTLLEVGVGTGLTLHRYPRSAAITGVDLSEAMLAAAQRRADELPDHRIRLLSMNAEAMAFPDRSFDCVAVPYVLSVTPNPERLRAEVRRVCRRGGTIFILNHFGGSPWWWLLDQLARPLADRIGFRSSISFEEQILRERWEVRSVRQVNLGGLSKLVEIRNI